MHCLHINCTAVLYNLMLNNKCMSGTPTCIVYILTATAVLYSLMFYNKCIPGTPICIVYILTVLQFYIASCLTINVCQEPLYALFTY